MAVSESESLINALHPSVVERIDPQFAEIYNKYQAPHLRADQVTYEEYNANRPKYTFPICPGPRPEVGSVKIYNIPVSNPDGEISIQVFQPTETSILAGGLKRDGKVPAHVNFHGGGFVIGGLETDESWCRQVCTALGCVVVNVDYRLSPEFPHPVPLTDSWAALRWVFASAEKLGIDDCQVSVGGQSAGGNIAAVLALMARDDPSLPKLVHQLLVVPLVDVRFVPIEGSCDPKTTPYESLIENEFAPCLPLNRVRWFYNLWLGTDVGKRKEMAENFWASPILASSHVNLAPASLHIAGIDSLASEGMAYHGVLTKAGVQSKLTVYEGCGHPFSGWVGMLKQAQDFVQNTFDELRSAYRREL